MIMCEKCLVLVICACLALIFCAGCAQPSTPTPTPTPTTTAPPSKTIVETAVADGRFTTLVAALQAANLTDALSAPGPFTVFAPTDDAFNKLPAGTVENLLKDPQGQLTQILLYHVVPGSYDAAQVVKMTSLPTLEGSNLSVTVTTGSVKVDGATVIITDIQCSNGIIHVIDTVMIPPSPPSKTIVETAVADGRFTTLVAALQAANLTDALSAPGPFTVFAPTDDAFNKLPAGTVENLLKDPQGQLTQILLYHVVSGKYEASQVIQMKELTTLQGATLPVMVANDKVMVDNATVIIPDIQCSNGVIHAIDSVMIPP
jgi:transforming growth factor-beta-induced protein